VKTSQVIVNLDFVSARVVTPPGEELTPAVVSYFRVVPLHPRKRGKIVGNGEVT
jgi:hypothetical protein